MLDVLGDADAFAAIRAARAAGGTDPERTRSLELLDDSARAESGRRRPTTTDRRALSRPSRHGSRATGARSTGAEVDDNDIAKILRTSDDAGERREAWEAAKTVGAEVAGDVRDLARLRNAAAAQSRLSRPLRDDARHHRVRRRPPVRYPRRGRRASPTTPFRAFKASLDAHLVGSLRLSRRPTCGRGTTTTRSSRRRRSRARRRPRSAVCAISTSMQLTRAHVRRHRPRRTAPSSRAATCSPAPARVSTRSASTSIAPATSASSRNNTPGERGPRRCSTSSVTRVYFAGVDRRPAVAAAHDAHVRHRRRGDAVRPARARARVAARRRRPSGVGRSTSSRRGSQTRAGRGCSSSPAGCS